MKKTNFFRLTTLLVFSTISVVAFSQGTETTTSQTKTSGSNSELQNQNRDEAEMAQLRDDWNQARGTFQIQIVNSRIKPQVDISIIEEINKSRKQDEVVYLSLMKDVRILILPKSVIQGAYEKLELFKYVSLN